MCATLNFVDSDLAEIQNNSLGSLSLFRVSFAHSDIGTVNFPEKLYGINFHFSKIKLTQNNFSGIDLFPIVCV